MQGNELKISKFIEIESEIISFLRERRLIPILGAGFTANSPSKNGKVPSGKDMKEYMIKEIESKVDKSDAFKEKPFSTISTYYNTTVPRESKINYIRDNFTAVELSDIKRQFLDINWLYVYTLNIDDAIESCSKYKNIILANKNVDFSVLDNDSCVIKLHGDAKNFLNYFDDNSSIFDFKQYATSITTNITLLEKLRSDFTYNNLMFIGCSLDDEFDLATIDKYENTNATKKTKKIFCTIIEPDRFKEIELLNYGITDVVVFDSYDGIYQAIFKAYQKSSEIPKKTIDDYKNLPVKSLGISYKENLSYLYHSKSLLDNKTKELTLPNFFIERSIVKDIINKLANNTVHVLYAGRVTGKSYILASLVQLIKDRDVYFFGSQISVPKSIVENLLQKKNTVIIFDTNSVNKSILFDLIKECKVIHKNSCNVILAINKSDKEIVSCLNNAKNKDINKYEVESRYNSMEVKKLNKKMAVNELPNYDVKKTIIDNIVAMEREFNIKGKFHKLEPYMRDKDDIVVLLLLATREKLYTSDLSLFNVDKECYEQVKKTGPLIQEDYTLFFEKTPENASEKKIVLNAKHWLYRHLGEFAHNQDNYRKIIDAYIHIVSTIIKTRKNAVKKQIDIIKFDVINEIFQTNYKGQSSLAKAIYEGLSTLLADNPHYFHQRAKCLLWQSEKNKEYLEQLNDALRYVNTAAYNFKIDYNHSKNEKIMISIAHTCFTTALIHSKICTINKFKDIDYVKETIDSLHTALSDNYNLNEIFEKSNKYDMEKVINYAMENINFFDNTKVNEIFRIYNSMLNEYVKTKIGRINF